MDESGKGESVNGITPPAQGLASEMVKESWNYLATFLITRKLIDHFCYVNISTPTNTGYRNATFGQCFYSH